jgi:hypothetical protein
MANLTLIFGPETRYSKDANGNPIAYTYRVYEDENGMKYNESLFEEQ